MQWGCQNVAGGVGIEEEKVVEVGGSLTGNLLEMRWRKGFNVWFEMALHKR
jgi:hypothetical protein